MKNKAIRRRLAAYFICFAILIQLVSAWGTELEPLHLVILHVNDTHGRLCPYDTAEAKDIGGIARMATRVKGIRGENEGRTLVLHAGDVLSRGDSLTVYYGGEVNMLAMEAIGYDAFTPGNGEFYFGIENLVKQTKLIKFPVLHANVIYKETGKRIFQPYIIKEISGVKIAILGLGIIRINHPSARPLKLLDHVTVAKEFVPMLHDKADLVIALTHIGYNADRVLAEAVPQIDIIVGGHSHTQLDEPVRIPRTEGDGDVIIVQAGEYCKFLGQLDVYLQSDESGEYHISKAEGKLLPIDSSIEADKEIVKLLEGYSEPLSEVVCISKVALANPEEGENTMGKMVAEALCFSTGADIALLDRGAVQGEIKPGEVTLADVIPIHPWRNRVMELLLTGEEIKKTLSEQDIFASGISYSKVDGEVRDLRIGNSPVKLDKQYKVAAGEFLLENTPSLQDIHRIETGERVGSVLLRYLEETEIIE